MNTFRFSRTALGSMVLICLCCSGVCQRVTQRSDEVDIRVAVLRYQMLGWAQRGDESEKRAKTAIEKSVAKEMNFKVFFVSINEKDPDPAVLSHLQDVPRVIKGVSACKIANNIRLGAVIEKETSQRGMIFRVNEIHWLNQDSVEVEGGYFCDGLCGVTETFKLHRTEAKWRITGRIVHRIS